MSKISMSWTVVRMKQYAKANDIKCPSLLKADLFNYIKGVEQERADGIEGEYKTSVQQIDDIIPVETDTSIHWIEHYLHYGWCTVPVEGFSEKYVDHFFDWLESCVVEEKTINEDKTVEIEIYPCGFRRDDLDTWNNKDLIYRLHGIIKHGIGHTEWIWELRKLTAHIFAELFECSEEDLVSSFDGGCLLFPEKKKNSQYRSWIHNDTPRGYKPFTRKNENGERVKFGCAQAIMNFVECGPRDGGLVLVENSHLDYDDYMKARPSYGYSWSPCDMSYFTDHTLIKVCAKAGELILFDGLSMHANCQPYGSLLRKSGEPRFRMCTYISMVPRKYCTKQELRKAIELYQKGRMSSHHRFGKWFAAEAEKPFVRGNNAVVFAPFPVEIAEFGEGDLARRLIGYDY